ncbi:MAG: hypothetical protein EBU90_22715 [Proteobacteria bacterium]|nr:hypothetical protein [Pseudomonadota bacterium]
MREQTAVYRFEKITKSKRCVAIVALVPQLIFVAEEVTSSLALIFGGVTTDYAPAVVEAIVLLLKQRQPAAY